MQDEVDANFTRHKIQEEYKKYIDENLIGKLEKLSLFRNSNWTGWIIYYVYKDRNLWQPKNNRFLNQFYGVGIL